MSVNRETAHSSTPGLIWNVTGHIENRHENQGDIHGVLFLDVDGTLTRPESMYAIDSEAINVLTEFIARGGICIFNTGATLGRLERTILNPIFNNLDQIYKNTQVVSEIFRDRIIAMPENGSATHLQKNVEIVENELYYHWHVLHPLHVPDKEDLRTLIETELVPPHKNSLVVGDHPGEMNPRQYILSWKGLTNTLALVEEIKRTIIPHHPEIHWDSIRMKAARSTIDFINAESGKQLSTEWILHELGSLYGPVLGFGDLGDEFAKVVPTFNVNQGKPNEYRMRGVPAMELTDWVPLHKNGYVITGKGSSAVVRCSNTGEEINVLRNEEGEIINADENKNKYLVPTTQTTGNPVQIKPHSYTEGGKVKSVQDAGKGTAWILRRLMDVGYFNKE